MHDIYTQMYNIYTCALYVYVEESYEAEKNRMLTWVCYSANHFIHRFFNPSHTPITCITFLLLSQ